MEMGPGETSAIWSGCKLVVLVVNQYVNSIIMSMLMWRSTWGPWGYHLGVGGCWRDERTLVRSGGGSGGQLKTLGNASTRGNPLPSDCRCKAQGH